MNKIKSFLEMDTYNTPSKLLYYFLETYGSGNIRFKDKINTCELFNMTFRAIIAFIGTWSIALFVSYFITLGMIANILILQFGVVALPPTRDILTFGFICFWAVILAIIIIFLAPYLDEWMDKRRYKKYVESVNIKPKKSIIGLWIESIKNKVCIEIDLNDFRG